ncbi:adenosine deaminase [Candidatus Symbiobacter mobilis CR]|uniref:adenosine deaminase n=1 Tax=Candidatus Symbiobacter mobilis CR TaxID=946483 RepID=U5N6N9_9BURK|nr:adenosine deaminase [Candidatus Symbiobacter mobilis CR]
MFGWLAPAMLDLYAQHPAKQSLDAIRSRYGLAAPSELWICTTQGAQTLASLDRLRAWWEGLGRPCPLRIWCAQGTDQLATQRECDHIRELTFRVTLLASHQCGRQGQLLLSLAGGRKTMSADLQTAGSLFGAHAWLHVVGPEPMPAALMARTEAERQAQINLFQHPLPPELAAAITPLVAGTGTRNELLDIEIDGLRVDDRSFSVPLPDSGAECAWPLPQTGPLLQDELQRRLHESSRLMGNFLAHLAESEHHENWRSLYRLPPAQIQMLRSTVLTAAHLPALHALPKADLHRHLGGCLGMDAQRVVAQAILATYSETDRTRFLHRVAPWLSAAEWPWNWPQSLEAHGRDRPALSATLLLHASPAQLQHNLYAVTEPRVALRASSQGFAAYERPGELSGSALLAHPAALAPYAQSIVEQARREGLAYLELRGTPQRYRPQDPTGFLRDLCTALERAGARVRPVADPAATAWPRVGFVWILNRRHSDHAQVVQQAVQAHRELGHFLLGLDLAGDEGTRCPEALAPAFQPAFAECLPVTIHAGEGEPADNIWQAAYHLHADRIGHGLTLTHNPALMARFRDRSICLELCPSSNREVVGYRDPDHPATAGQPDYPLREFIQAGLPVALCTDNPAISRTSLPEEYLAASRMTPQGLTVWEALALTRQAFVHAFLPSAEREVLLKRMDAQIFEWAGTLG